jgi:hypothetical protein
MLLNQLLQMPFIHCVLLLYFIRFLIFIAETEVQCQGNACGISVRVSLEHFFFTGFHLFLLVLYIHASPILPEQQVQYVNLSRQLGLPGLVLGCTQNEEV